MHHRVCHYRSRSRMLYFGLPILAGTLTMPAGAQEQGHQAHQHPAPASTSAGYQRSEAPYQVPNVTMIREDGKKVAFPAELDDGRPVMLNFIYASCAAICPVLSQVFSQVQKKLGKESRKVHMVSISIDPENDTPAQLRQYAKKFKAGPQWQHYTGTQQDSIAIQKAFDAYRGDKMNHIPVTFLRAAPGKPWVRLDGFVSPDALIREYRQLFGQDATATAPPAP